MLRLQMNIESLAREYGFTQMMVRDKQHYIDLMIMELPERLRGRGRGTRFMAQVCELADRHGVVLGTCPEPLAPGWTKCDKNRLIAWYMRFGFVENPDDDRYRVTYVRFPQSDQARGYETPTV